MRNARAARNRGDHRVERVIPLVHAPVEPTVLDGAPRAEGHAVIPVDHLPFWRGIAGEIAPRQRRAIGIIGADKAVQEADMRGIDLAFDSLRVVAFLGPARAEDMGLRQVHPVEMRHLALLVGRPHIGPEDAAPYRCRVGGQTYLLTEVAVGRFRGKLGAIAVDVELPAVIDAADATFLVAAKKQVRAPMRTVPVDEADPPLSVAKGDKILAEQAHPDRCSVPARSARPRA